MKEFCAGDAIGAEAYLHWMQSTANTTSMKPLDRSPAAITKRHSEAQIGLA